MLFLKDLSTSNKVSVNCFFKGFRVGFLQIKLPFLSTSLCVFPFMSSRSSLSELLTNVVEAFIRFWLRRGNFTELALFGSKSFCGVFNERSRNEARKLRILSASPFAAADKLFIRSL